MLNQLIKVISNFTTGKIKSYAASRISARNMVNGFLTAAHHTLMVVGVAAITVLAIMYFKPEITGKLKAFSPITSATAEDQDVMVPQLASLMDTPAKPLTPSAAFDPVMARLANSKLNVPSRQQQQLVSDWISKRYRVAGDATYMLVSATYLTADEIKLDPLLILAVMAIESRFNPFAESPVGAQGLMQVMSKLHHEKFKDLGGVKAALNPVANIRVGSLILKDYVTRGGSVEAGLKRYVGAAAFATDFGYGAKVLAEYEKLKEVASGRKVSIYSTNAGKSTPKPEKVDNVSDNDADKAVSPTENKSVSSNQHVSPTGKAALVAEL